MNKSTNPASRSLLVAVLALGSSFAAFAPTASATLLLEESFAYSAGVLGLVNGGTGFNTEFRSGGSDDPATWNVGTSARYTIVPGLTYAGLTSSGGALQLLDLNSNWDAHIKRSFTPINTTTTLVWGSYLLRLDEIVGRNGFQELKLGQPTNLNASFTFGVNAKDSLLASNVTAPAGEEFGPAIVLGDTNLIVWAYNNHANVIDFNVGELLYWINPTLGNTPSFASSTIMLNAGNSPALGTMQIYGQFTDFVIDEIRIGDSFASVTPIPEASSFAALAGAFGLLAAMSKRRRRTG